MTSFTDMIQQGSGYAWLFIPTAILLGALHGLEPGHSKTMMAAFVVAIRGTVKQAMLLGLAATISHTAVVWGVVLAGMYLARGMDAEASEPWFQLASAVLIVALALWMIVRARRDQRGARQAGHHHDHHHHDHHHPAPAAYQDAHERAHGEQIARDFQGRPVTTWQIILFGLTGGLIPCPAAITVLLICLQLREIPLGVVMVLSFSVGLAVTLVAIGVIASVGMRHVSRRWSGFDAWLRRAPYASGALMILVGLYVGAHALGRIAA